MLGNQGGAKAEKAYYPYDNVPAELPKRLRVRLLLVRLVFLGAEYAKTPALAGYRKKCKSLCNYKL